VDRNPAYDATAPLRPKNTSEIALAQVLGAAANICKVYKKSRSQNVCAVHCSDSFHSQHYDRQRRLCTGLSKAVLRIRDMFVRIRIRGSVPLTNGSGSCYFRHWPRRRQPKKFISVFLLFSFWMNIYIIFKDKKSKRSHKIVGIRVFLDSFAWCEKEPSARSRSGSAPLTNGSGSRRPKNLRIRIRHTAQKRGDGGIRSNLRTSSIKWHHFLAKSTSLHVSLYLKVQGSDVAQNPRNFSIDENPGPDLDPGAPLIQLHLLTQFR
jgi:hypothetical protein